MLFYFDFKPRRKFLPEKPDYSLEKFGHETALFAISIIIFLKSIRHLLKANNNETFKNLRSSDSEDSKLNSFWISTEISKCEQLYFLFTVFKISSLKNFWMFFQKIYSFMYSYYSYWMSFLLKSSEKVKKLLFFHFIPFSAPPYCTKPLLICLEMAFHIVFQVCFISPEAETLEQGYSGVTRT